jgi:hypothetical protein
MTMAVNVKDNGLLHLVRKMSNMFALKSLEPTFKQRTDLPNNPPLKPNQIQWLKEVQKRKDPLF